MLPQSHMYMYLCASILSLLKSRAHKATGLQVLLLPIEIATQSWMQITFPSQWLSKAGCVNIHIKQQVTVQNIQYKLQFSSQPPGCVCVCYYLTQKTVHLMSISEYWHYRGYWHYFIIIYMYIYTQVNCPEKSTEVIDIIEFLHP